MMMSNMVVILMMGLIFTTLVIICIDFSRGDHRDSIKEEGAVQKWKNVINVLDIWNNDLYKWYLTSQKMHYGVWTLWKLLILLLYIKTCCVAQNIEEKKVAGHQLLLLLLLLLLFCYVVIAILLLLLCYSCLSWYCVAQKFEKTEGAGHQLLHRRLSPIRDPLAGWLLSWWWWQWWWRWRWQWWRWRWRWCWWWWLWWRWWE